MQRLVMRLNDIYRKEPALFALDDRPEGFEWVDFRDAENTVWSFLRKAPAASGHGRHRNLGVELGSPSSCHGE
jgi:1,4-alpha-glucan branching enzyme